ncbi:MAG: hypothetical protein V1876_04150 [Candidatus Peregrinibacteria bacterium]
MPRDTRNIGLAFLLSIILVTSVAIAANLLFASPKVTSAACYQSYSLACVF